MLSLPPRLAIASSDISVLSFSSPKVSKSTLRFLSITRVRPSYILEKYLISDSYSVIESFVTEPGTLRLLAIVVPYSLIVDTL